MRRLCASLLLFLSLAAPAGAGADPRPVGQVPLLPLGDGVHEDIDNLLAAHWRDHFNTNAEHAFGPDAVRVGRFDLNGDGKTELLLMVDAPGWNADPGSPFVVAQWIKQRWVAVGWGWGDEDTLFATDEVVGGWRSLDTGTQVLRWSGRDYGLTDKR